MTSSYGTAFTRAARKHPSPDVDCVPAGRVAGWPTVFVGWSLSQRAQPSLFPDASPCYGTRSTPVTRHCPPGSYCPHADGELRAVNEPNAKIVFWTAANTTLTAAIAAALHGVVNELVGARHVRGALSLGHPCDRADGCCQRVPARHHLEAEPSAGPLDPVMRIGHEPSGGSRRR
ncbi:hypothetical protein ABWK57_26645 [Streptomyces sp. NPDC094045]|uniref:hypothetical protein n=1 Tax=Streptomyces sp. NPDC094045 TaxID=3161019 RepID=UPI003396B9AC